MSELEKHVRRRMQEEYAKGSSAEEIAKVVRDIFNSIDISGKWPDAVATAGRHGPRVIRVFNRPDLFGSVAEMQFPVRGNTIRLPSAAASIGCCVRKPTASRFQTLIAPIATVILVISSSEKCAFSGFVVGVGRAGLRRVFVTASTQPSSGAFAGVVDRRFPPDAHQVDPLFGQPVMARFLAHACRRNRRSR